MIPRLQIYYSGKHFRDGWKFINRVRLYVDALSIRASIVIDGKYSISEHFEMIILEYE